MNDILMDYVCEELEDVERDGLKAGNLDSTDKLVNIKKNLMKIEKMEGEMNGYSMDDGYWNAEGSYGDGMGNYRGYSRADNMGGGYSSARRGMHYVRGHYSRADGMGGRSYRDGMSYAGRRRDSMGRYSRADGKESMMEHLRQMMDEAQTDKERKVVEEAMAKMEKA